MNCRVCGAELKEGAVICFLCGSLVQPLIDWKRLRERLKWIETDSSGEERQEDFGRRQPGADGRIPYGAGPVRGPGADSREVRSPFANLSFLLGIVGFFTLIIPYISLPMGIMAILFGALGLKKGELRRTRAIVGIVAGSCLVLIGGTLIICVSALLPYQEDLIRIWNEYMQQFR